MQIQKITPLFYFNKQIKNQPQQEPSQLQTQYSTNPINISFEARVDKGLTRFYEANANRMPKTVKTYIETLSDKNSKTPLQAQRAAFIALASATSIAQIKDSFDEPLFDNLKDPSESKATRGVLGVFRENKELLDLCNQSILNSGENLTVWLVKKIFLEGKTLEEINKDFNNEINTEFKALYLQKETNEEPIKSTTLKALGIKMPEFEYQQSLRYTREGYSDIIGDKLSQSLKDFYASLPIEERTARARKSVEKFENWWQSMSYEQKLDIIAEKENELELLQRFNSSEFGKKRSTKNINTEKKQNSATNNSQRIKVESSLSQDDLFKIWAGNNLKIFKENLTELDKQRIETKREQNRAKWWVSMTPVEQTEYINNLRKGLEPLRYAMIDAWNNNEDILIELSHTLTKSHFNKPTDILYGTESFNEFMSEVMTEFWQKNPEFASRIGESISKSHDKIKSAMQDGNFEFLKRDILQAKTKREKVVLEAVKNYREILPQETYNAYPQYMRDFIDAYSNSKDANPKFLPVKYMREYYEIVANDLPQDITESWTKALKEGPLTEVDRNNLLKIRNLEPFRVAIISRALEATLSDILYECTSAPEVYSLSHADCKMAIKQITDGNENIKFYSHKLNKDFNIPILNRDIDVNKIDKLYEKYMEPLSDDYIEGIIDQFIDFNYENIKTIENKKDLEDFFSSYLKEYQSSCNIIFDPESPQTVEAKAYFAKKFISNLPSDLDLSWFNLNVKNENDFKREEQLQKIDKLMRRKFYFLPKDAFNLYAYELNKALRNSNQKNIDTFENVCCVRRKTSTDHSKILLLNRNAFTHTHKLFSLCLEQALADTIYESSGNQEAYAFRMEELFSYMEAIMLLKKFPMKEENELSCNYLGRNVDIRLKRRIQPYQIEAKFREYYDEMVKYIYECVEENKNLSKKDILYILNPDDSKNKTDEFTLLRINNTIADGMFNRLK